MRCYADYYIPASSVPFAEPVLDFNPSIGRFIGRDPLKEKAGSNVYAYVGNSPMSRIDPLGTFSFVDHYFDGNGRTVNLGDVGLGGAFEASASVASKVAGFNDTLASRAAEIAQDHCDDPFASCGPQTINAGIHGSTTTNVTTDPGLFAVGHSTFFTQASCQFNFDCGSHQFSVDCKNHYFIRDYFADPLDIGIELYGGTPYEINYDFQRTFSRSGLF